MKTVVIVGLGIAGLASTAQGQSFNCDLDIFGGTPEIGNGAPSDGFGAAANQLGRWNRLNAAGGPAVRLVGLDGVLTNAWWEPTGGFGSAAGFNNPVNTGDYALLLNDISFTGGPPSVMTLQGIGNGWYRVFTYAVIASVPPRFHVAQVFVEGSITPNPGLVTGPMPGNSFAEGITHSIHEVLVEGNLLKVTIPDTSPSTHINGFQIVAVPEPSTLSAVGVALLLTLRRKRRA